MVETGIVSISILYHVTGVSGDAADIVHGVIPIGDNQKMLAGSDPIGILAIVILLGRHSVIGQCWYIVGSVVQQVGVIAVVSVHIVAGEGGAVTVAHRHLGRVEDGIVDSGHTTAPTDEAAAFVGVRATQPAIEETTPNVECVVVA